jgi:hypothetical protein
VQAANRMVNSRLDVINRLNLRIIPPFLGTWDR